MTRLPNLFLLSVLALALVITERVIANNELPNLGGISTITINQQERLGRNWLRANYNNLAPLEDVLLQDYTEEVISRLQQGPALAPYRINLIIPNTRQFNAFIVPGGVLGINLGVFLLAENEGEFASVVAHELGHLSQEHFLRLLEYSRSTRGATLAGLIAGLALVLIGNPSLGVAAIAGTFGYQSDEFLSVSREFENEADSQGIELLRNGNFPLRGAATLLSRLRTLSGRQDLAVYQTTHPLTITRINNARLRIQQERLARASFYSEDYQFARARALYFANPDREFSNSTDVHSQYAQALSLMAQGNYEQSSQLLSALQQQYQAVSLVFFSLVESLINQGATNAARELLAERTKFSFKRPLFDYFYALSYEQDEDYAQAIQHLEKFFAEFPEKPAAAQRLAVYYERVDDSYNLFRLRTLYSLLTGDATGTRLNFQLAREAAGDDLLKQEELSRIPEIWGIPSN